MTARISRLIAMAAGATTLATACLAGEPDMGLRTPLPAQVPMTEGLADLGKVKLWYWDTGGAGEVIVFLRPGSGSAEFFPYQQPVFTSSPSSPRRAIA